MKCVRLPSRVVGSVESKNVVLNSDYFELNYTAVPIWEKSVTTRLSVNDDSPNYVFVNANLVRLLKQKLRRKKGKNLLFHYLYFCSTISYLAIIDKRFDGCEFVPINRKIMTSMISRDSFIEIVNNLIDWRIIQVNSGYQANVISRGYKLLAPFNQDFKKRVIEDSLINTKLNRHKNREVKELIELPFAYQYLAATNTWIELDSTRALTYNKEHYFSQSTSAVYDANFYSISAYEDHSYRFKVDKFGNRAHTNLTNLKSDIRAFLHVGGEALGQVDIKNSQPLFFYIHIKNIPEISDLEKEKYKSLVESGLFYEFFMMKLGIPIEKRSDVKHKILAALFFDKYRNVESRYVKVFREEFPRIMEYITKLRKRDYKRLAQILQKSESKFVIEKVVPEFILRFGNQCEFVSTIHDSIVVKTDKLEDAMQVIEECFASEGIKAQLSSEKF